MAVSTNPAAKDGCWVQAIGLADLAAKRKAVVRLEGKQILLWQTEHGIYACNNRCPHEGYPLAEGTLAGGCILTCNWHNWKFDLESGQTLVGGDALRLYPVRVAGQTIEIDITDPPPEQIRAKALAGLREAFEDHDYERIAREVARTQEAGGDPLNCLIHALDWAKDGTEFGTTHAQAAAPDWLALRSRLEGAGEADRMIPIIEIIGHLSWDSQRERGPFPFPQGQTACFDAQELEAGIEAEDEGTAIRQVRAGLAEGGPDLLRATLQRASLRHYQSFGHPPIYLDKAYDLMARLGPQTHEALTLPLVRAFCMGSREDLIPEFRAYGPALEAWDGTGTDLPVPEDFRGAGVKECLTLISGASGRLPELVEVLFEASAAAMLHFNPEFRHQVDKPVQHNVDWLDFTHAITHLNAAAKICREQPNLWPNAVLQTGCYLGRNAAYVDWRREASPWAAADAEALFAEIFEGLLDHGEPMYIFPAHTLKLATALREEMAAAPAVPWIPTALAALNRFAHEPVKRKHARRAARQALGFVRAQN